MTESEKKKWNSGQYYKEIKVEFPEYEIEFGNEDIYAESLTLQEALFDGNGALEVVGCIASRLSIEMRYIDYHLKGLKINVSVRIDGGEWHRIFTGFVDSIQTSRDKSYQKFECYDALRKYADKNVASTYKIKVPCTIKALRDEMFAQTAIQQVPTTLVNDDVVIVNPLESDDLSFSQVIKAICQANGVFGIINREGKFEYRSLKEGSAGYNVPSTSTIPSATLYPGRINNIVGETSDYYKRIEFEDYKVHFITNVIVRDTDADGNYGEAENHYSDGNIYLVQNNVLLCNLDKEVKDTVAQRIYNKLVNMAEYIPFEAVNPGMPYIEVGDAVNYYVYDRTKGVAHEVVMTFNVLKRCMKGLQWLEDAFYADGEELQPSVNRHSEELTIEDVREEVRWKTDVTNNPTLTYSEGGKYSQEYVDRYNSGLLYDRKTIDEKVKTAEKTEVQILANIQSVSGFPINYQTNCLYLIQGELVEL